MTRIAIALGAGCLFAASVGRAAEPALPQTYLDTTYAAQTGRTSSILAGGDLQAAIDSAQPGDTILLPAGATFTGNFVLPPKTGNGWIYIRTSTPDSNFPAPGTRITPSAAGLMAKIVSPNDLPAFDTPAGAHHYRLIGLEITFSANTQYDV